MLHVVGGTYREICTEPPWDELYGSGLRAAIVLAARSESVALSTYVSDENREALGAYAGPSRITLHASTAAHTPIFTYSHGLARPFIDPAIHLLDIAPPLVVESECALRFGMLEGSAVVRAKRTVYDPQATYKPEHFSANGSSTEHLAIVANRREARSLTGESVLDDMGQALLQKSSADVVIIKMGPHGARVFMPGDTCSVSAYRTATVFPIGSGDVFSAMFAYFWAELSQSPVEAAEAASQATARYCSSPAAFMSSLTDDTTVARVPPYSGERSRRIYLAGPFFTTAQRWLVHEAREALFNHGVEVFSPFHDVGMGPAAEIAEKDIEGLKRSDAVLAIVDEFDAGTLFEVGYARAQGIPVVAFVQNAPEGPLKMIHGSGCDIVGDFVSSIYRVIWAALERRS